MNAVYDRIRNLDAYVASKLDPRAATEKTAELHWALVSLQRRPRQRHTPPLPPHVLHLARPARRRD